MSNISGDFNYWFSRIEPKWENRDQTGINKMVIGLSCAFSGEDDQGNVVNDSVYVDGVTGFNPSLSYDNLTGNLEEITNEYASSQNWFEKLEDRLEDKIMKQSIPVKDFPFVSLENESQEENLSEDKKAFSPRNKRKPKRLKRKEGKQGLEEEESKKEIKDLA